MSLNFDFLTSVSAGGLAREQPEVDAAEPDALGCWALEKAQAVAGLTGSAGGGGGGDGDFNVLGKAEFEHFEIYSEEICPLLFNDKLTYKLRAATAGTQAPSSTLNGRQQSFILWLCIEQRALLCTWAYCQQIDHARECQGVKPISSNEYTQLKRKNCNR
jgi:hypothetical protein